MASSKRQAEAFGERGKDEKGGGGVERPDIRIGAISGRANPGLQIQLPDFGRDARAVAARPADENKRNLQSASMEDGQGLDQAGQILARFEGSHEEQEISRHVELPAQGGDAVRIGRMTGKRGSARDTSF